MKSQPWSFPRSLIVGFQAKAAAMVEGVEMFCWFLTNLKIEKRTSYPKGYFFILGCCLSAFCLFFVGGAKLNTDLVSFIYPAYKYFKVILSVDPTDETQ